MKFTIFKIDQITLIQYAVLFIIVATGSLLFRSDEMVSHRPLTEDGYYSFTVARNIAEGKGITVNMIPTNGFQPLFTILTIPAFMLSGGDKYLAIRYVLILHYLFFVANAFLLGMIGRNTFEKNTSLKQSKIFWWITFLYLSSVFVFICQFNGLETGCLFFFYILAWYYCIRSPLRTWKELFIFGSILGLLVLTRIDAVFLVITVSVYLLLFEKQQFIRRRVIRALIVSGTAVIVSLPWWLYNILNFGSIIPTSGRAYQSWIFSSTGSIASLINRIIDSLIAFSRSMMPLIYFGQNSSMEGIVISIIRLIIIALIANHLWRNRYYISEYFHRNMDKTFLSYKPFPFIFLFLLSIISSSFYYLISFGATWFYTRYFSPLVLISIFLIGLFIIIIKDKKSMLVQLLVVCLSLIFFFTVYSIHIGNFRSSFIDDQIHLVNKNIPNDVYVTSFQTGTLGFFRDRVLNLDGKVNPEVLTHRDNLLGYIGQKHIEWLCDEQWSLNIIFGRQLQDNGWKLIDKQGNFALYHKQY